MLLVVSPPNWEVTDDVISHASKLFLERDIAQLYKHLMCVIARKRVNAEAIRDRLMAKVLHARGIATILTLPRTKSTEAQPSPSEISSHALSFRKISEKCSIAWWLFFSEHCYAANHGQLPIPEKSRQGHGPSSQAFIRPQRQKRLPLLWQRP